MNMVSPSAFVEARSSPVGQMAAMLPADESTRLAILNDYQILDTAPDERTAVFVRLAANLFSTPISLVSLVDKDRQWFKAAIGLDASETPRDQAFCAHAILSPSEVMVVEDARLDPRFCENPLVTGDPEIRFYAGAPLVSPEGYPLGTLCVIDRKPRQLAEAERERLADLAIGVASVLDLHRSTGRLQHLATHDHLTGLANRALFEPVLTDAINEAVSGGERCVLVCLDLDRFKLINDRFGHGGGDEVLRAAADRLRAAVEGFGLVARLGGDEFAVLLSGTHDRAKAANVASRIIDAFAAPLFINDEQVFLRTSIGIASAPDDAKNSVELFRLADAALYRAKAVGRGTVVRHGRAVCTAPSECRSVVEDLRRAIQQKSFTLNWQPYFDLRSGEVHGQEALIRWDRPGHGLTSPDEFIPAAEECGLILGIDEWVLEAACNAAAAWQGRQNVAVNVSPATFCAADFMSKVQRVLSSSGLGPNRLVIEITERTAIDESYATAEQFEKLHEIGVRIALDDFGCGHAALGSLQKYEFDKLKLDRSLIQNIGVTTRSQLALAGMFQLAGSLGMLSCAEGVETEDQLAFLRASGCNLAQGFLLGKPTLLPCFSSLGQMFSIYS